MVVGTFVLLPLDAVARPFTLSGVWKPSILPGWPERLSMQTYRDTEGVDPIKGSRMTA